MEASKERIIAQLELETQEDKILLSILEEEHAMLHILDFKNPEVLRRNSDLHFTANDLKISI